MHHQEQAAFLTGYIIVVHGEGLIEYHCRVTYLPDNQHPKLYLEQSDTSFNAAIKYNSLNKTQKSELPENNQLAQLELIKQHDETLKSQAVGITALLSKYASSLDSIQLKISQSEDDVDLFGWRLLLTPGGIYRIQLSTTHPGLIELTRYRVAQTNEQKPPNRYSTRRRTSSSSNTLHEQIKTKPIIPGNITIDEPKETCCTQLWHFVTCGLFRQHKQKVCTSPCPDPSTKTFKV